MLATMILRIHSQPMYAFFLSHLLHLTPSSSYTFLPLTPFFLTPFFLSHLSSSHTFLSHLPLTPFFLSHLPSTPSSHSFLPLAPSFNSHLPSSLPQIAAKNGIPMSEVRRFSSADELDIYLDKYPNTTSIGQSLCLLLSPPSLHPSRLTVCRLLTKLL